MDIVNKIISLTPTFSLKAALQEAFSELDKTTLRRGERYYEEGRVGQVRIKQEKDGIVYQAKVQGSSRKPYEVEFSFFPDAELVLSSCNCPISFDCKHITALLLKLQAEHMVSDSFIPKENLLGVARMVPAVPDKSNDVGYLFEKMKTQVSSHSTSFITNQQKKVENRILLYIFESQRYATSGHVRCEIKLSLARKLKAGGFGRSQSFRFYSEADARCLTAEDLPMVSFLKLIEHHHEKLENEYADALLEKIIHSGRSYYKMITSEPLQWADPKQLTCTWISDERGRQQLQLLADQEPIELFFTSTPWYIQVKTHKIGHLQTVIPPQILKSFYCMPLLDMKQADQMTSIIQAKFQEWQLPLPITPKQIQSLTVDKPVPCLHFSLERFSEERTYFRNQETIECVLGKLFFRYGAFQVSWDELDSTIYRQQEGQFFSIDRDKSAEQQAVNHLTHQNLSTLNVHPELASYSSTKDFINHFLIMDPMVFSAKILPQLQQQGFVITFAEDYPFRLVAQEETEWYSQIEEDRREWFNLELGVFINGEKLNLLPILQQISAEFSKYPDRLQEIAKRPESLFHVRLADNRLLPIPFSRIKHILDVLLELQENALSEKQQLQLSKMQLMCLEELQKAFAANELRWLGGEQLRNLAQRLKKFQGIRSVASPALFQGVLRDYQQQGLNWLQFLREYELSGILADEMGLGKTVQMLAHIVVEKAAGRLMAPCLIIAPTSLMYNWQNEAQQFTPTLKVLISQGKQRKETFEVMDGYDVILTTYPLLFRDRETLLARDYHLLILDEAQLIKNHKTQASAIVNQIKAKHRLCMTGTPLENHLGELWSLFHFLMPGLLGDEKTFKRFYRTPIEKHQDKNRLAQLRARTTPFLLRRTKKMVATELPPKTEIIHHIELDGIQRDLYETMRLQMQQRVMTAVEKNGLSRSHITILDALLKLRQICCDPALLKMQHVKSRTYPSAKLDSLLELLKKLREEDRRILLFSQFTEMLAIIEKAVQKIDIPYVKLTGETIDRHTAIESFQSGKVPLFLISLKAGGLGLNLTTADTVIHYDPWWNPAVEQQATDRSHRLGQTKQVFVYKLVVVGTVEEKIIALQQRKKILLDGIFSEQNQHGSNLAPEDLQYLFA